MLRKIEGTPKMGFLSVHSQDIPEEEFHSLARAYYGYPAMLIKKAIETCTDIDVRLVNFDMFHGGNHSASEGDVIQIDVGYTVRHSLFLGRGENISADPEYALNIITKDLITQYYSATYGKAVSEFFESINEDCLRSLL